MQPGKSMYGDGDRATRKGEYGYCATPFTSYIVNSNIIYTGNLVLLRPECWFFGRDDFEDGDSNGWNTVHSR